MCSKSVFYNALNTEMKEKKEGVIRLKDATKALIEEVLEYLYTGHVDINDKNAFELMAAADYLLFPSLKLVASKFIEQTLCISNCIMAYYSSVKYQCAELQEGARRFVLANFMAVTKTEDFLNLSVEQVEEWIASDEIVVKEEEEVFMAILRWTEKNGQTNQSFGNIFRHVRCIYVSRNYLFTVILHHELVKRNEECLNLVLDAMKEVSDGTEACFLNQAPRKCLKTHEDVIFACGGEGGKKALCYLPSENKWYKMPDMHFERQFNAVATSACKGKQYVVGGNINEVERYDPLLNSWTSVKSMKEAIKFAAAVTFQGYLYVIGGVINNTKRLSTVQKYNPETNLWQEGPPLSSPRSSVCAVADGINIYVIGGSDSSGVCLDVVEKFDVEGYCWTRIASIQAKRKRASGVSLQDKIFVFGGAYVFGGCPCEMYDKVTDVWTEIASAVVPWFPTSAVCFKGQIFVLGEFELNQSDSQGLTLQVYNVDSNEWKPCGNISLGSKLYRISTGRILKEVLDFFEEIPEL